jgi:hypothetical protein
VPHPKAFEDTSSEYKLSERQQLLIRRGYNFTSPISATVSLHVVQDMSDLNRDVTLLDAGSQTGLQGC